MITDDKDDGMYQKIMERKKRWDEHMHFKVFNGTRIDPKTGIRTPVLRENVYIESFKEAFSKEWIYINFHNVWCD